MEKKALVIEDNERIRRDLFELLEKYYKPENIEEARTAAEAIKILDNFKEKIQVVFTDIGFPYYSASFKLTEKSYEELEEYGLPEDILNKLKDFENQSYIEENIFVETIEQAIGLEQTDKYKSDILKSAYYLSDEDKQSKKKLLKVLDGVDERLDLKPKFNFKNKKDTGRQILCYLREELSLKKTWVAVITARGGIEYYKSVKKLLGEDGEIYHKPFNDYRLEAEMCIAINKEYKGIEIFLPDGYNIKLKKEKLLKEKSLDRNFGKQEIPFDTLVRRIYRAVHMNLQKPKRLVEILSALLEVENVALIKTNISSYEILASTGCLNFNDNNDKLGKELTSWYWDWYDKSKGEINRFIKKGFIKGEELKINEVSFRLTEQSYEKLEEYGLPEDILNKLKDFENQSYIEENIFVETIEQAIGSEQTDKYKSDILKSAINDYTFKDVLLAHDTSSEVLEKIVLVALLPQEKSRDFFTTYEHWVAYCLLKEYNYQLSNNRDTEVLPDQDWETTFKIATAKNEKEGTILLLKRLIYEFRKITKNEIKKNETIPEETTKYIVEIRIKATEYITRINEENSDEYNMFCELLTEPELIISKVKSSILSKSNNIKSNNISQLQEVIFIQERLWTKFSYKEDIIWTEDIINITKIFFGNIFSYLSNKSYNELKTISEDFCHIDRDILDYYLIYLVLDSENIKKRYLLEDIKDTDDLASTKMKYRFRSNLSNFILHIISILQKNLFKDLKIIPCNNVVSPRIALDAKLYIVDRLVHVEFKLDERFDIFGHLGRGIKSEINLHIKSSHYRDHLLHAIDVFLLGYILLNAEINREGGGTEIMIQFFQNVIPEKRNVNTLKQLWAVTSLLHDVGYQIEKENLNNLSDFFSLEFYDGKEKIVPPSKDLTDKEAKEWLYDLKNNIKKKLEEDEDLLYFPDKEEWDHGVLSALRVAQIAVACDILSPMKDVIHAISHHNLYSKNSIDLFKNPLSFFLIMCDELQEWGRYKFDMESLVKAIYLKLNDIPNDDFYTKTPLKSIRVNLKLSWDKEKEKIKICCGFINNESKENHHHFLFELFYNNSIKGQYDVTTNLLFKIHNFQRLKAETSDLDIKNFFPKMSIILYFPKPEEYLKNNLSEYDIYTHFSESFRYGLPLLKESNYIDFLDNPVKKSSQLCRLTFKDLEENQKKALFDIYIEDDNIDNNEIEGYLIPLGMSNDSDIYGEWININPKRFVKKFLDFKEDILKKWLKNSN